MLPGKVISPVSLYSREPNQRAMRILSFLLPVLLLAACRGRDRAGFAYFRLSQVGVADSFTRENKGYTTASFLSVEGGQDSFVYYEIHQGAWKGALTDSFRSWLQAGLQELARRSGGFLSDTSSQGGAYDGPEFLVDWKGPGGEKMQCFIYDAAAPFAGLFDSLGGYAAKGTYPKRLLTEPPLDPDGYAVHVMKVLGVYEKKPTPYIPKPCLQGWDSAKLYGAWRKQNWPQRDTGFYSLWVLHPNGTSTSQRFSSGVPGELRRPPFVFSAKDSLLGFGPYNRQYFKVLTLTENCLVLKDLSPADPDDPTERQTLHFDRVR